MLAAYESSEIVDLWELWQRHEGEFPGVMERLRRVGGKGPTLREGEKPSSSGNRSRNDAFVLLLAGKLLAADLNVVGIDGAVRIGAICQEKADIVIKVESDPYVVECKRPQSWSRLEERVKQARRQIMRCSVPGIVAVDCSVLLRPPGTVVENRDVLLTEARVGAWLEQQVAARLYRHLRSDLLGLVLFARMPAMTLVDAGGDRYRRDWTSSWLVVANRYAAERNARAMERIRWQLATAAKRWRAR